MSIEPYLVDGSCIHIRVCKIITKGWTALGTEKMKLISQLQTSISAYVVTLTSYFRAFLRLLPIRAKISDLIFMYLKKKKFSFQLNYATSRIIWSFLYLKVS